MFGPPRTDTSGLLLVHQDTLSQPPIQAERPVCALDVGKPVSILQCCPLSAAASFVLAAGDDHATLLSVKEGNNNGLELSQVDKALPHSGPVDAAAWGEAGGQLRLVTVNSKGAMLHTLGDEQDQPRCAEALSHQLRSS